MVTPEQKEAVGVTRRMVLIVVLIILALLSMTGASWLSSYLEYRHFENQQTEQTNAAKDAQAKAAKAAAAASAEEKARFCSTFMGLAALKAPTGSPVNNPSRAYEQSLQRKLSELSTDRGC
jgi:type II secretory pathway pseudopilin PulG